MTHVTFCLSHVTCYMWNAYVDPWDMLNNFCFHVYGEKWVCVIMSHVTFRMSHVTLRMSHVICQMLMLILGTCWTTFVLTSMLKSEYLWLCHMSHVTCLMSNAYVDPWDMLNNFCFHVYAQKWVLVFMSHVTCHMSHVKYKMLMLILGTCWTTFVLKSLLKSEYL